VKLLRGISIYKHVYFSSESDSFLPAM